MATLAEIVANCTPEIVWKDSSQWATPHPNDLYTSNVKIFDSEDLTEYISFHVSLMRLILCRRTCFAVGTVETVYYDMGDFTEPVASNLSQLIETADKVKEYAAYVIESCRKYGDLSGCPSSERIDNVDENFNPTYPY